MVPKKKALTSPMKDKDLLTQFSPLKVGKILPTSHKPTPNVFESYKPRKEQCLDYKISETFANFQKGDLKCNVRETCATYEPLPPGVCKKLKKKVKRFSGGPPQYHFIDEIWLKQREVFQKSAIAKLLHATSEKKHTKRKHKLREHEIVQRLVGPEWFMELSPKQLEAIDDLDCAIEKDIDQGLVVNTLKIMATLGLVLRPNQRHIEIALRHCCRCPVEFLLVLYHILDPNREMYSLNDRLILSAVAHLAITITLKELHIRIPSPPYETDSNIAKKPIKKTKQRFKSPYLQPQTFYPHPPKFSGIYENKHIQYPESPYFAYLPFLEMERKEFKRDVKDFRNDMDADDKERWKEYDAVHNFYDILPGAIDTLRLLPASKPQICLNMLNEITQKRVPSTHLCDVGCSDDEDLCCNCLMINEKKRANSLARRKFCNEDSTQSSEEKFPCDECVERERLKNSVQVIGGYVKMTCHCDPVPFIQGTGLSYICDCLTVHKNRVALSRTKQFLIESGTKYVISEVIMSKFGPIYNLKAALGDADCGCLEYKTIKQTRRKEQLKLLNNETKFSVSGVVMTKEGPTYVVGNAVARKPCDCIKKYRDSLIAAKAQHILKQYPANFVNAGVVNDKQFGPVYSIAGACEAQTEVEVQEIGKESSSSVIIKPYCVKDCGDYFEYEDIFKPESNNANCKKECFKSGDGKDENEQSETDTESTSSSEDDEDSCSSSSSSSESSKSSFYCECCALNNQNNARTQSSSSSNSNSCKCKCQVHDDKFKEKKRGKKKSESSIYCAYCTMNNEKDEANQSMASTNSDSLKINCREALDKFIEEKCQCEECLVKIRQGYATHIHGGTKLSESGTPLNLIQGIHQPQCSCMHNHLEKLKQEEQYKARAFARYNIMKNKEKYLISGVTMTKEGPVYNITGAAECHCKEQQEKEYEHRPPETPKTGRVKLHVLGVKELPKENVYILANAMEIEECDCMAILKKFEEEHSCCVDEFDQFMQKIKEEQERESVKSVTSEEKTNHEEENPNFNVPNDSIQPNEEETNEEILEEKKITTEESSSESSSGYCDCCKKDLESSGSSSDYTTSDESTEASSDTENYNPCSLRPCTQKCDINPITLKERQIPEYFMSKRYVIFKKIPKDTVEQEMILKHILKGMAEDGFALAKLPEVYKLPIFKLWWEMRSEVYWTQADRRRYVNRSIHLWNHTDLCYKEPEIDTLPFTHSDIGKLTWANAKLIRNVTSQYTYNYYRKVKQVTIATGREFFASTFDYEFPTPGWRDCAFAYIPTKEEAVFPYKIYQSHDAKNIPTNKKFKCY